MLEARKLPFRPPLYDIEVESLAGEKHGLERYQGRVMLVVNTASKCGFTPQFAGLEDLHRRFSGRGLAVLGFPCNQFRKQDPGTNEEIGAFCRANYGVSFPMHAKVDVNGAGTHPLFARLKSDAPGALGSKSIKWNFTKFLVDRDGQVYRRYSPMTEPAEIARDIELLLDRGQSLQ